MTGGTSGGDTYIGNIDATGDIITYDTVGKGVKKVVYNNQGEDHWAGMSYGASTIKASGCGPTSLAIVISTLTGQTVTPEMTCAFSIANGEYIYGLGTCHSFPTNAAHHWGLNCERVGKDRMGDVVKDVYNRQVLNSIEDPTLYSAIAALNTLRIEILVLRCIGEKIFREIGELTGISDLHAKDLYFNTIAKLRKIIGDR